MVFMGHTYIYLSAAIVTGKISYEIPVEAIVKEMSRSGEATPSTGISFPVSGLKQPAKVFVEVVQPKTLKSDLFQLLFTKSH